MKYAETLSGQLEQLAALYRDNTALLAPNTPPATYQDLWSHIQRIASGLNARGICCRDRVAIVLPNGPEIVSAFLAAASAPLNPAYRKSEFEFYLSDLSTKKRTRRTSLDAFSHAEVPAVMLVRKLKLPRSFNRHPLSDVLFQLRNMAAAHPGHTLSQLIESTRDRRRYQNSSPDRSARVA